MLDLMGMMGKGTNNNNNSRQLQPSQQQGLQQETTPLLLPSNASGENAVSSAAAAATGGSGSGSGQQQYYFLNKASNDYQGGTSASVRDLDGGEVVEEIPQGSHTDEFAPKQLAPSLARHPSMASARRITGRPASNNNNDNNNSSNGGFWSKLFGGGGKGAQRPPTNNSSPMVGGSGNNEVGTMLKPRKAPVKVEPKVFFANERTFLAWMHLSVTLAGASIAILAFAEDQNPYSQLYGVLLLPVAIAFIIYSMYQYSRRAFMIRNRSPGPYEDTVGPAVLGIMLMVSIVAQFALKLYTLAGQ